MSWKNAQCDSDRHKHAWFVGVPTFNARTGKTTERHSRRPKFTGTQQAHRGNASQDNHWWGEEAPFVGLR